MRNNRNRPEWVTYQLRSEANGGLPDTLITYVRKLAMLGLPRHEIAANLGANRAQFEAWCASSPAFRQALDAGLVLGDFEIIEALKKRAVGYMVKKREWKYGKLVREWEDHVPADVTAIQMWLYNRQPDKWRPVGRIEPGGPATGDLNARAVEYPVKAPELPEPEQPADAASSTTEGGQRAEADAA